MAFHHKYLAKKDWHVLNRANRQRVEEAEAKQASLSRRVEERRALLERERRLETNQALIGSQAGERRGLTARDSTVAFLYTPPPGFVPAPTSQPPPSAAATAAVATTNAAALRLKAEGVKSEVHDLTHEPATPAADGAGAAAASSPAAGITPLPLNAPPPAQPESYEERRARHRTMTAQQIREELHPALRGAPVKADYVRASGTLHVKPLGHVVRDVRCVRCGGIGHTSAERECPRFGEITPADESRQAREDPVAHLRAHQAGDAKFKLLYGDDSYVVGGFQRDDPLQQVVPLDDDDDEASAATPKRKRAKHEFASGSVSTAAASSPNTLDAAASSLAAVTSLDPAEQEFLASLSSEDMRILLKQLKKSSTSSSSSRAKRETTSDIDNDESSKRRRRERDRDRHRHRHKSRKKEKEPKKERHKRDSHKRKRRSRSDSDSSSSSSDSEHERSLGPAQLPQPSLRSPRAVTPSSPVAAPPATDVDDDLPALVR